MLVNRLRDCIYDLKEKLLQVIFLDSKADNV